MGKKSNQQSFSWSRRAPVTTETASTCFTEILHWFWFIMEARDLSQKTLRGSVKYPTVLRYIWNKDPTARKRKAGISSKILGGRFCNCWRWEVRGTAGLDTLKAEIDLSQRPIRLSMDIYQFH